MSSDTKSEHKLDFSFLLGRLAQQHGGLETGEAKVWWLPEIKAKARKGLAAACFRE
jgi:hypothetical protein